jgi:hypothetical protein
MSEREASRVLLVVYFASHYVELSRVAALFQSSNRYEPVFVFGSDYHGRDAHVAECARRGIRSLEENGEPVGVSRSASANDSESAGPLHAMRRWVGRFLNHSLIGVPLWMRRHKTVIRTSRHVLSAERAKLLIAAEDNVSYTTAQWIRAAHDLGIKSLIVPYTVANATEPAEAYWDLPGYQVSSLSSRLVARHYPQWIYEHRGRRLQRLPPPQAVATELLGIAPSQPWLMNSGFADAVAVESRRMLDYYRESGLPTTRLVPTGTVADDVLAASVREGETIKNDLLRDVGRSVDDRLILLALMPDQHQSDRTEFGSYAEMTEWIVTTLAAMPRCAVLLRPHPREAARDFRRLEKAGGVVTTRDTASLIGAADLYVASASATIRWAIAARRPVINYDVYRYGYTEYRDAPSVDTVTTRDEFKSAVARWHRGEISAASVSTSPEHWGRLDGASGARLLSLIDHLTLERTE